MICELQEPDLVQPAKGAHPDVLRGKTVEKLPHVQSVRKKTTTKFDLYLS